MQADFVVRAVSLPCAKTLLCAARIPMH
jgi:hypothetical protein